MGSTQGRAVSIQRGKLYLVPAPLDFGCEQQASLQMVMPLGTLQIAARIDCWICENAKSTRAYLKRINELEALRTPVQMLQINELPREIHKKGDHNVLFDARPLLSVALKGQDIGLVSEAGMPAIADPGSSVVRAAHDLGLQVIALTGPMSLMLTLASSGLNGQNFAFVGYLPQDPSGRVQRIRELESLALKTGQTQIFIETPYRNVALIQALLSILQGNTRLALGCGLTLDAGVSHSAVTSQWKRDKPTLPLELPTVFCIGR